MSGSRSFLALLSLVSALALGQARDARAQGTEKGVFGLGIILGEPTGISAKLYLSDNTAVDAAVGGAFVGGGLHVHADFLLHPWVLENRDTFVLPAYVGVGVRLLDHDRGVEGDFHIGARGVVGMLFDFKEIPIDAFVEVAAVLDVRLSDDDTHGGLGLAINAGIGARYYF
jgi:hypothetical protein